MNEDVPVVLQDLPTTVRGFTTFGSDHEPIIILNSRLSRESQRVTYKHEMNHILFNHLYEDAYEEYGEQYGQVKI